MDLEKNNLITLDGKNEYLIVSKVIYNNTNYLFLVNIYNNEDIKVCYEKKENNQSIVVEVEDELLLNQLILLFAEDTKDMLEDIESE